MRRATRLLCGAAALWLLAGSLPLGAAASGVTQDTPPAPAYEDYLAQHRGVPCAREDIKLPAGAFSEPESRGVALRATDAGVQALYCAGEDSLAVFRFSIPESALFEVAVEYEAQAGHGVGIERDLLVNGALPCLEARALVLPRAFSRTGEVRRDNQGNDIRPALQEQPRVLLHRLSAADGLHPEPLLIAFPAGENTLALRGIREPMALHAVYLLAKPDVPDYPAYLASVPDVPSMQSIRLEGEGAAYASDQSLYPQADLHNSATLPFELGATRMNYIGGYNWRLSGQYIQWEFTVPASGRYQLSLRARQNSLVGMPATRGLLIDDRVPFREAAVVPFPYDANWQWVTPRAQDGQPCLIYLEAGRHSLRLSVNIGPLADIVRNVQGAARELSQLYSKVIMITGTVPDPYRDYLIGKRLPGFSGQLARLSASLKAQIRSVERLAGQKVAEVQVLDDMALQLDSIAYDPETLPGRLDRFRENLTALSSWALEIAEQPLDIDCLMLHPPGERLPDANPGFVQGLTDAARSFGISFVKNYSNLGNLYDRDKALNVWVFMGREQANVLKAMIDDSFTPGTGIPVNLNIVTNTNTLLFSASGGDPCDVAVGVGGTLPVDYGIRGALSDLNGLPETAQLLRRFKPASLTPFSYDGKLYAMPLTQSFPVLFYRADILKSLGADIPDTWEDVYRLIALLQERNLTLAPGMFYEMFVLQNGGRYFSDDMSRSLLDAPDAIDAFERYTELFTHYGLPQAYDFYNRFRTGEMPVGIADFSMYNTLMVAAPEIKGLWGIAPVPGTRRGDGTIDRSVAVSGSAAVIFRKAKHPEQAAAFLDWLTSTPVQVRYGRELEAVLGLGARYFSANPDAVAGLSWPAQVYAVLMEQWGYAQGIPTVLGSYYIGRHIGNAFREVVSLGALPREAIRRYVEVINREMQKKREEFGLDIPGKERRP